MYLGDRCEKGITFLLHTKGKSCLSLVLLHQLASTVKSSQANFIYIAPNHKFASEVYTPTTLYIFFPEATLKYKF